jgi:parallel beta-helix repeat protein
MNSHGKIVFVLVFLVSSLTSLGAIYDAEAQSDGAILISGDGSVSGTDKIQRSGNLYTLTGDISGSNIVVECNNIVLDGAGFTLRGAGGWGMPGVAGEESTPAINLTCSNVTVRSFNIVGWKVGVLGAFNDNRITDNNITEAESCVAIYANGYDVSGNYLAGSIYGVRLKGDSNRIYGNHIVDNYGGFLISSSSGIIITANTVENCNVAINTDNSGFEVYRNNFINNTRQAQTASDAFSFAGGGGTMPPWDNGEEGNYWSGYMGADANGDGIGDAPYVVHEGPSIVDRFPLIAKIGIQNAVLPSPQPTPTDSQTASPTSTSAPTLPATETPMPTSSPSAAPSPSASSQQPTHSPNPEPGTLPTEVILAATASAAAIAVAVGAVVLRRRKQASSL